MRNAQSGRTTPCSPVAALAAAVLCTGASAAPIADDASESAALLQKAEELVAKGRYKKAVGVYEELAERFPQTDAGRVGARRSRPSAFLGSVMIVDNGPSANRVDVVLMGDGYTLSHQKAFDKLAKDVPLILERLEPFAEYASYFNYHRASVVSAEDGIDGFGRTYDTALDAVTLGTIQGHASVGAKIVRGMLDDEMPEHDSLALAFVKRGSYSSFTRGVGTVGGRDAWAIASTWAGTFAGLAYETPDATRAASARAVRAPNLSLQEEEEVVPWAHMIEAKVRGVGVYEGAGGQERNAWRPTASGCLMGTAEVYCPVCREALLLATYALVDPIEESAPVEDELMLAGDPLELSVRVMTPATHHLDVEWWVIPEVELDPELESTPVAGRDRRSRGALHPVDAKPVKAKKNWRTGEHSLQLKPGKLDPGRYRVICRAVDSAKPRGERKPWVIRDDDGLLESERAWWVVVAQAEE